MVTDGQDIMISDSQDVTDLSNDRVHWISVTAMLVDFLDCARIFVLKCQQ